VSTGVIGRACLVKRAARAVEAGVCSFVCMCGLRLRRRTRVRLTVFEAVSGCLNTSLYAVRWSNRRVDIPDAHAACACIRRNLRSTTGWRLRCGTFSAVPTADTCQSKLQLLTARHIQLLIGATYECRDGVQRHSEPLCNAWARHPGGEERHHLPLTLGEVVVLAHAARISFACSADLLLTRVTNGWRRKHRSTRWHDADRQDVIARSDGIRCALTP